jgi:hypothetical protein
MQYIVSFIICVIILQSHLLKYGYMVNNKKRFWTLVLQNRCFEWPCNIDLRAFILVVSFPGRRSGITRHLEYCIVVYTIFFSALHIPECTAVSKTHKLKSFFSHECLVSGELMEIWELHLKYKGLNFIYLLYCKYAQHKHMFFTVVCFADSWMITDSLFPRQWAVKQTSTSTCGSNGCLQTDHTVSSRKRLWKAPSARHIVCVCQHCSPLIQLPKTPLFLSFIVPLSDQYQFCI